MEGDAREKRWRWAGCEAGVGKRSELGRGGKEKRDGPAGLAHWAREGKGPVGEGERAGPGCWVLDWVSVGFGLWVPFLLGFLSTSYCFSIPNSNKFEFKYKF